MDYRNIMRYFPLYNAAQTDDWKTAEAFFNQDPDADTAYITYWRQTALHIAVGTNSSHGFVEKLVNRIAAKDIINFRIDDNKGDNPLHYAAQVGNTNAAKALLTADAQMALITNAAGYTALTLAACYGRKETLEYLLELTPDGIGENGILSPEFCQGGDLITSTIAHGFYDVAMKLINKYPKLVTEKDRNGFTALQALAKQPGAFPSGRRSWWFWKKNIIYFFPLLKNIHDTKLKHKQTDQLMKLMITTILDLGEHEVAWKALSTAVEHGVHELIEECLGRCPGLIFENEGLDDFLMPAIKCRQVKEVEKFMGPFSEALNEEKKTPRMVFINEHKDLVEKGEKWMKDTASSSTLVAALIVTVSFAAIFTVPGGNKDNGTAYFLRDSTFILFVISDVVALFSAVTSVLMFLATLTSRYAVDDFLYALPKRITIGLVSLFISIASIMVTFCAAIALVLREQFSWIAIPVGLIAGVPVTFFALLQFPLLVELVVSTYGPSIFRKQNNRRSKIMQWLFRLPRQKKQNEPALLRDKSALKKDFS